MHRLLLILLLVIPSLESAAQDGPRNERQLRRALNRILEDSALTNATVGVHVVDVASGKTLFAHNEGRTLMPASNVKLYTTAAALDQLGHDFTWTTNLETDGLVDSGVLVGNLIVRGSGDPVIGGRYNEGDITAVFRGWAQSLKDRGIQTVKGDLIGDDDLFDDLQLGYGWSWDDEPWWYSAEIGALTLNDNVVDFTVEPTAPGSPATVTWTPHGTSYVQVQNATVTLPEGSARKERYTRTRDGNDMVVAANVPVGYTETESIAVHNPTLFFMHVLREVLVAEGVAVTGRAVDVDDLSIKPDYNRTTTLASHTSPNLARVVHAINKRSHNLYAEQVLKTLGVVRPDTASDAPPGSARMGWAAGVRTLAAAGLDTARTALTDGSGLSRMNFVSPEMSTSLLRFMWHHPDDSVRVAFHASLPIAGQDGTLESRMTGGAAFENVRAKTGSFTGASTLSGYVTTRSGTTLAFSLMMNMFTGSTRHARRVQDEIAETLATYRR